MIKRTTTIALEFAAGLLIVFLIVAAVGVWRVSQGPVSLGFLRAPLEGLISSGLSGFSVQMKDAVIERGASSTALRFSLRDLVLVDEDGSVVAKAPRATFGISWQALASGEIVPSRLALIGPRMVVERRKNGSLRLGFGTPEEGAPAASGKKAPVPQNASEGVSIAASAAMQNVTKAGNKLIDFVLSTLSARPGTAGAASHLEDISIRDAAVTLFDEGNDSIWFAPAANLVFERVPEGVRLFTDARIGLRDKSWSLQLSAIYRRSADRVSVTAKVNGLVLAEIARKVPILSSFAQVRTPLDGEVRFEVTQDGEIVASRAALSAGAGYVDLPGFISKPILIDEGTLNVAYGAAGEDIVISDSVLYVGGTRTSLAGRFSPVRDTQGNLESVRYRLAARGAPASSGGESGPLIDSLMLEGNADIADRRLDVDSLFVSAGEAKVLITGYLREEGLAPAIRLNGKMSRIPLKLVKALWPPAAAPGAREWIIKNMLAGTVEEGEIKVDITSKALARALEGAALPNEQLSLSFTVSGAETRYLGELPPLRGGKGVGLIRGDSFDMRVEEAYVAPEQGKRLALSNGHFRVDKLGLKGPPSRITFELAGPTASALRIIDNEPLGYATRFGLDPAKVGGDSRTSFDLRMPLRKDLTLDDVQLKAVSALTRVRIPDVLGDADIDGGSVDLEINKERMTAKGDVTVNGVAAKLAWDEDFTGSRANSSHFELSGTVDDWARRRLGLDLSRFLQGPAPFTVKARGSGPNIRAASISADLSRAYLTFNPVGWVKPPGQKATAELSVDFPESGHKKFRKFRIKGPEIDIAGRLELGDDDGLIAMNFPKIKLGANAMKATGKRRKDGVTMIELAASEFDARPMIRSMFKDSVGAQGQAGADPSAPVEVRASIARVYGFNNAELRQVSTTTRMRGGSVLAMTMTGTFADRSPLEVTVSGPEGGNRALRARTTNAGELLRALNVYPKVRGGQFRLNARLAPAGQPSASAGEIRIANFRISDDATLQQVAERAGSSRGMRGQGGQQQNRRTNNAVYFTALKVPFVVRGDVLQIGNAIVKGPSIGATAHGSINMATDQIDIAGTFIPAYALNSAISNVPIVGDVLAGGRGQGVFGITFAVDGTLGRPRFRVNPVSAIAPGIFRRLFEMGGNPANYGTGTTSFDDEEAIR